MALLWLPDDIARILIALASAGEAHGYEYHQALRDVALAFGLTELDISSVWVCKDGQRQR